ncbi:MAG TPA: MFS transporter [Aggregatilineaceae bacterium]|nr:MFS transporter [Aggregatilineaceae bacterium]
MQSAHGQKSRWIGLLFICISLLVISLDNTVLNVALPSISNELGASASQLQWVVDAYVLVFAALLLTMGSVSDRIGRKRALQFGVGWFGLFSLGAALSTSTNMLIGMRALLGIGGATIMPATLSLITAMFPNPKERAQAIGIWAAVFGLGVGIGPVLGGWLLQHYAWHSVFFINVPIATIAVIGGHFALEESKDEHAPRPDVPGVLLSIGGLFSLVYAIIEAGQKSWTASNVLVAFAAAGLLLVTFAWWENRTSNSMLPVRFFKNMSFTGANLALTLLVFSMFGALFFLSQYLQSVQGYTALQTGVRLFPMALTMMVAAASSARIARAVGTKLAVSGGILIAAIAMLFMAEAYTVDSSYPTLLFGLMLLAVGLGTAMAPATNSIMGSVPVDKAGVGSAMNDTNRMVGGALGVAVLGTFMNNAYRHQVDTMLAQLQSKPSTQLVSAVKSSIQGAHMAAAQLPVPAVAQQIFNGSNQAFVSGMTEAMFAAAIIMGIASVVAFIILPAQVRPWTTVEGLVETVDVEAGVAEASTSAVTAGD